MELTESTIRDLMVRAQEIRGAQEENEITAKMVGSLFEDIISLLPTKALDPDTVVTKDSNNTVTSNAVYTALLSLGSDIEALTYIDAIEADGEVAPNDYKAGQVFYTDGYPTHSDTFTRRRYHVAKQDGNAGDSFENSSKFINTFSSAEAYSSIDKHKKTSDVRYDIVQDLSETQLELAQANLGIRDSISKIESITVASAQDIRNLWASNPISEQEQQQVADGEITDAGETTTDNQVEH